MVVHSRRPITTLNRRRLSSALPPTAPLQRSFGRAYGLPVAQNVRRGGRSWRQSVMASPCPVSLAMGEGGIRDVHVWPCTSKGGGARRPTSSRRAHRGRGGKQKYRPSHGMTRRIGHAYS
ncbi:hypothetical protein GQ53DRAFT_315798 [Thozetella sp. PMI_491]|nr:hypothetical protein GQ53DRAFT_315798 [Thozetella sp. PMI_491]